MKKFLFTLLALMMVAPLANAQRLASRQTLPMMAGSRTLPIVDMRPGVAPQELIDLMSSRAGQGLKMRQLSSRRIDANTTSIVYGTSYTDTRYGETSWATTFTFDTATDSVTIEGLLDGMLNIACATLRAPFVDGVITLPTHDFNTDPDNATFLFRYYNMIDCYLFGGTYVEEDKAVTLEDEVKLYVADDYSTIDNAGKAIGIYGSYGAYGTISLGQSVDGLVWTRLVDGPANTISTTTLAFDPIMYPKTATLTFTITSTGAQDVNFTVSSDDSHFTVDKTEGSIKPVGSQNFTVTFTPGAIGTYKGNLKVNAGDSVYTVVCTGEGVDVPRDFSSLVTKGDASRFTWDNTSNYPWIFTDDSKTVATNGNQQVVKTNSLLTGTLQCPKATRITFDYDLMCQGVDTMFVWVDGHKVKEIFSNGNQRLGTCTFMVSSGVHAIVWDAQIGKYSFKNDYMHISNIQLDDAEEFELVSPNGSVTNMAMNNASNYDGTIYRTAEGGTFTVNVATTGACAVSFDVAADANNTVTIAVDGTTDRTITANETYHHDFADGGNHTVVATLGGVDAAISEVYMNEGAYTETVKKYLVVGQSYLTEGFTLDLVNGKKLCYPTTMTLTSAGRVYFDNLVENIFVTEAYPIKGSYANGVISISTPTNVFEGTLYGFDADSKQYLDIDGGYYNNRYWLESGTLSSLEQRDMKKEWVDEFTISCNDDNSVLTASTGFGVWRSWSWFYNSGVIEFVKPGAKFYETVSGKVKAIAETDTLDFGSVYANSSVVSQDVMIVNLGDATEFEAYVEGDSKAVFSVTPTVGSMDAQSSQTLTVTYTPTRTGNHTAKLVVVTEGNEVEVVLKGQANEMPNFDSIVTEGSDYIRGWDTSSDYPWYVEDGVAYSGNKGIHNSSSTLSVDFIVPEGYYARLSAAVKGDPECYYDAVHVALDGTDIESFNYRLDYAHFGQQVDEGEHTLTIYLTKNYQDIYLCDDQVQMSDLRIRLYAKGSDVAMMHMPKYYFQQLVPWDLGDSITVYLKNAGTNVLTVNSVTAPEPFEVGEIADVPAGEYGAFTVYMKPCEVNTYCKTITLHTSAGDVEFDVEGTTDYVRYLGTKEAYAYYAPLCTYYNMYNMAPVYVQSVYESSWLEGLQGAQLTDMTFLTTGLARIDLQSKDVDWAIKETGDTLDMTTDIPEGFTTVYSGEQLDVERYEFTIPFDEPYTYQGGNFTYLSRENAYEPFAYGFYFVGQQFATGTPITGVWESNGGWQTIHFRPFMRLRYIPAVGPGSGVEELNVTDQLQGDGYTYDLMGRRVNPDNLTPGIYIRNGKKFAVK